MNKFILCVLDRENKTKEELEINAGGAWCAAYWADTRQYCLPEAVAIVFDAADAAYWAAYNESAYGHAAADIAAVAAADVEYLLNKYFEAAGESREEYEKVIKEKR